MNAYPRELIAQPQPVVFLMSNAPSLPDIHEQLVSAIVSTDSAHEPSLEMRHVPEEQEIPRKTQPYSARFAKDGRFVAPASADHGFIKSGSLQKHFSALPSCIIYLVQISGPPAEWTGSREDALATVLSRLHVVAAQRDAKVLVVGVELETGNAPTSPSGGGAASSGGSGESEHSIVEERLTSLRRRCGIDSKHVFQLVRGNIAPYSHGIKKLAKALRSCSMDYYLGHARRLKRCVKALGPGVHDRLKVRYVFKIGLFYEMQASYEKALKYYTHARDLLFSIQDAHDGMDMVEQHKAVAEWVHVKLCVLLLRQKEVGTVVAQFRAHIERYRQSFVKNPWSHYAWVSHQYVAFAELLSRHNCLNTASAALYYHSAAVYARKRKAAARDSPPVRLDGDYDQEQAQNYRTLPPRFVGGIPRLFDSERSTPVASAQIISSFVDAQAYETENKVDHHSQVMHLLYQTLDLLNPEHKRRRCFVQLQLAEECMEERQYEEARVHLMPLFENVTADGWTQLSTHLAKLLLQCAFALGNAAEYVDMCLRLLGSPANNIGEEERNSRFDDVVSFCARPTSSSTGTGTDKAAGNAVEETEETKDAQESGNATTPAGATAAAPAADIDPGVLAALQNAAASKPEFGECASAEDAPRSLPHVFETDNNTPSRCCGNMYLWSSSWLRSDFQSRAAHDVAQQCRDQKALFHVEVTFSSRDVQPGELVSVHVEVTSRLPGPMHFSFLELRFTDDAIQISLQDSTPRHEKQRNCVRVQSDERLAQLKQLVEAANAETFPVSGQNPTASGSLLFLPEQKRRFSFRVPVPEASVAYDTLLAVERVRLHLNMQQDLIGVNLQDKDAVSSLSGPHVVFSLLTHAARLRSLARMRGEKGSLKKISTFLPVNAPLPLVCVRRPKPQLRVLPPPEHTTVLQGSLHRVDIQIETNGDEMHDARLYMTCDPHPPGAEEESLFFWWPVRQYTRDGQVVEERVVSFAPQDDDTSGGGGHDRPLQEGIVFQPMALSSSMQPLAAILLPACGQNQRFVVPLFIRSRAQGHINIGLRVEYRPASDSLVTITSEATHAVTCAKPFSVFIQVTPQQDTLCGVRRDPSKSIIVADDIITHTFNMECLQPAPVCVRRVLLRMNQPPAASCKRGGDAVGINDAAAVEVQPAWHELRGNGILWPHTAAYSPSTAASAMGGGHPSTDLVLAYHDVFSSVFQTQCHGEGDACAGDVLVEWTRELTNEQRVFAREDPPEDPSLCRCSLRPMHSSQAQSTAQTAEDTPIVANGLSAAGSDPVLIDRCRIAWSTFEASRCPHLHVSRAPFNVELFTPTVAKLGSELVVQCRLTSAISTHEQLNLTVAETADFVLSGPSVSSIFLQPDSFVDLYFRLVPLTSGQLSCPHIKVTWQKYNSTVAELGSYTTPRYVFVEP